MALANQHASQRESPFQIMDRKDSNPRMGLVNGAQKGMQYIVIGQKESFLPKPSLLEQRLVSESTNSFMNNNNQGNRVGEVRMQNSSEAMDYNSKLLIQGDNYFSFVDPSVKKDVVYSHSPSKINLINSFSFKESKNQDAENYEVQPQKTQSNKLKGLKLMKQQSSMSRHFEQYVKKRAAEIRHLPISNNNSQRELTSNSSSIIKKSTQRDQNNSGSPKEIQDTKMELKKNSLSNPEDQSQYSKSQNRSRIQNQRHYGSKIILKMQPSSKLMQISISNQNSINLTSSPKFKERQVQQTAEKKHKRQINELLNMNQEARALDKMFKNVCTNSQYDRLEKSKASNLFDSQKQSINFKIVQNPNFLDNNIEYIERMDKTKQANIINKQNLMRNTLARASFHPPKNDTKDLTEVLLAQKHGSIDIQNSNSQKLQMSSRENLSQIYTQRLLKPSKMFGSKPASNELDSSSMDSHQQLIENTSVILEQRNKQKLAQQIEVLSREDFSDPLRRPSRDNLMIAYSHSKRSQFRSQNSKKQPPSVVQMASESQQQALFNQFNLDKVEYDDNKINHQYSGTFNNEDTLMPTIHENDQADPFNYNQEYDKDIRDQSSSSGFIQQQLPMNIAIGKDQNIQSSLASANEPKMNDYASLSGHQQLQSKLPKQEERSLVSSVNMTQSGSLVKLASMNITDNQPTDQVLNVARIDEIMRDIQAEKNVKQHQPIQANDKCAPAIFVHDNKVGKDAKQLTSNMSWANTEQSPVCQEMQTIDRIMLVNHFNQDLDQRIAQQQNSSVDATSPSPLKINIKEQVLLDQLHQQELPCAINDVQIHRQKQNSINSRSSKSQLKSILKTNNASSSMVHSTVSPVDPVRILQSSEGMVKQKYSSLAYVNQGNNDQFEQTATTTVYFDKSGGPSQQQTSGQEQSMIQIEVTNDERLEYNKEIQFGADHLTSNEVDMRIHHQNSIAANGKVVFSQKQPKRLNCGPVNTKPHQPMQVKVTRFKKGNIDINSQLTNNHNAPQFQKINPRQAAYRFLKNESITKSRRASEINQDQSGDHAITFQKDKDTTKCKKESLPNLASQKMLIYEYQKVQQARMLNHLYYTQNVGVLMQPLANETPSVERK